MGGAEERARHYVANLNEEQQLEKKRKRNRKEGMPAETGFLSLPPSLPPSLFFFGGGGVGSVGR